ncbi:MAG TPA: hypothetical protein VF386_14460 [Usitatibacter sp.]
MKLTTMVLSALVAAAPIVAAGAPNTDSSDDYRDGYRAGYDDGFQRGYEKGMKEGGVAAVPAPSAPPRSTGPITISRAVYGTSSRICDATRWAARSANGRMSANFDVTNSICGDPSPGDRKSLDVTYVCGTIAKTASANEHRSVYLDCTP